MKLIAFAAHGCPVGSLGAYGNEFVVTTHLDRLAAEGVTFDRHIAERPDPAAARSIWWNADELARFPRRVLVRATRPEHDAPTDAFTDHHDARTPDDLLELLSAALDSLKGDDDWLLWIDLDHLIPPWNVPANLFELYVEDLIEDDADEADPIEPWSHPPTGWFDRDDQASWELLHRSFAAAMTAFDADLGRLFDLFRDRGLDETSTWAFTGSFGFPLGEHGLIGPHRAWLYEEFVHVPMIVRRPGGAGAGERVPGFTQHADFWTIVTGEAVPPREKAISRWSVGDSEEVAIRTETKALLVPLRVPADDDPRPPELYEKPGDRWEANNVQPRQVAVADELEAELRKELGESPPAAAGGR